MHVRVAMIAKNYVCQVSEIKVVEDNPQLLATFALVIEDRFEPRSSIMLRKLSLDCVIPDLFSLSKVCRKWINAAEISFNSHTTVRWWYIKCSFRKINILMCIM